MRGVVKSQDMVFQYFGPVHKKDEHLSKKNYRPISILTNISKVIEKCINQQMNDFNQHVL